MTTLARLAELPVTEVKGLGPERAKVLGDAYGITTVLDLLQHYPYRHHDRSRQALIEELAADDEAWLQVRVVKADQVRGRGKTRFTYRVTDGSGFLTATWFTPKHRRLREGQEVLLFGKVGIFRGQRQMTHPRVEVVGRADARIVPVYPESEKWGIESREVEAWVGQVLRRAGELDDPVPPEILDAEDLVTRTAAYHGYHRPESMDEVGVARKRLVFDELFRMQVALLLRKQELERTARGIRHDTSGGLVDRFLARLPFELTDAQRQAIDDITADLAGPHPMHRLLQGDVGSGKTVVGVAAMLTAVQGGHQAALMAPTEVLAEQHAMGVRRLLDGFTVPGGEDAGMLFDERPLTVELLTNRTTGKERERLLAGLADGTVDIVIGTHALIEEGIRFRSLGVVVIDEQHRFGVEQRAALREKGDGAAVPDVLVMTATPIPRTAAMTVYGDLDVTTMRVKPGGRKEITTIWRQRADDVWAHVREEVAAGHQAYVVCPLVEESEKLEVRSAEATFAELSEGPLAGLRLGLLHGRIRPVEKEATMEAFRSGRLDVLVATTVIEVGVDVPNATVMVILDADRFGIAQLHQLRGRVGRGAAESFCYLVGEGTTADGERRLQALVASNDGFELAEVDLEVRGEGTLFDTRQKGRNDLKLASLLRDRSVVLRAREHAGRLLAADPGLASHPDLLAEVQVLLGDEEQAFLEKA